MNFGSRRSDELFAERGAVVLAGLGRWVGVRADMLVVAVLVAAVLLRPADGAERTGPVAVGDEGCGVAELMEAAAGRNAGVLVLVLAQPARTSARVVIPAREWVAYRRGCLTSTHSHDPAPSSPASPPRSSGTRTTSSYAVSTPAFAVGIDARRGAG